MQIVIYKYFIIFFFQHGDEYSMSIEQSQIDAIKIFYETYPLYSVINIDKAEEKLASLLNSNREGLFDMELYFFLREFSLLQV